MVLKYHSLMESGVVLVSVGKDQKRFLIHSELASSFPSEILQPPTAEEIDEVVFGRCSNFTLCEERTGDIVTLFKFAFENVDSEEFESIGDIKFEGMGDIKGDYTIFFYSPTL
ncbi:uncharacterized protein N7496_010641 [Penicillium cataractarum]|uniref:Uncharacterized protein n=1 Tax=Penicillium cataractarum TaxID=2100454 RepID=A0A9W9V131_9EURO|nr:uncharacterized protein N7496_010641 [Penicillium cataractarum]KAJ5364928.1 hypothetical protein N7496_010641 [Penicillium cataractarum]